MEQDYAKIAKMMQAFSDPKRLMVLDTLSCGERCAAELQEALSMTQPTTSYHIKLRTDTGVASMRSEGKYSFYSLDHNKLLDFIQSFARFIAQSRIVFAMKSPLDYAMPSRPSSRNQTNISGSSA